jgi:cell division protein FtsB
LAEYNLWRRGGLDEMPSSHTPAEIGVALDEAVYLLERYDELERDELRKLRAELDCSCNAEELLQVRSENAALRHTEENLASTVRGLEFENEKLERENAAVERTIENLRARLWGTEFELEKAKAELDWLNTNCVSADPIMGRSTYRWTIEHDEPDIRAAIDAARTKKGGAT